MRNVLDNEREGGTERERERKRVRDVREIDREGDKEMNPY